MFSRDRGFSLIPKAIHSGAVDTVPVLMNPRLPHNISMYIEFCGGVSDDIVQTLLVCNASMVACTQR